MNELYCNYTCSTMKFCVNVFDKHKERQTVK